MSWLGPRSVDGGVDRIPLPQGSGALSLCGKHVVGPDPDAALARAGATTIVCLNERYELEERYPQYVEWLERHRGDRAVWHPIPDLHAPSLDEVEAFLDELVDRLDAGESLLIQCGAGMGRAGTIAACVLIVMGVVPEDAVRTVAAHRPLAGPEAGAQERLIEQVAAHVRASRLKVRNSPRGADSRGQVTRPSRQG
jgi:protein-tyrosine phosphatase